MTRNSAEIVAIFALFVAAAWRCPAAEPVPRTADLQAIEKSATAYLDALNLGDFDTAARFWTADGEYIDEAGRSVPIAELWRAPHEAATNDPPQPTVRRVLTESRRVRFIAADVALEEGESESIGQESHPSVRVRYAVVWVRQQGQWKLTSLRDLGPAPAAADPLAELEWLIGDWIGSTADRKFVVHAEWSQNRRWIIRRFSLHVGQAQSLSGVQIVGWDPAEEGIRSWVFDSEGGFSSAHWEREGVRWKVVSTGVRGDGVLTEALNTYTRLADNKFEWGSIDLGEASEQLPESKVEFTRQENGK